MIDHLIYLHIEDVIPGNFSIRPIVPPLIITKREDVRNLPYTVLKRITFNNPDVSLNLDEDNVALAYYPFDGYVQAIKGKRIPFKVEGLKLVFVPIDYFFETADIELSYGQHIKHKLYFYNDKLVYCTTLHGGPTSQVNVVDVERLIQHHTTYKIPKDKKCDYSAPIQSLKIAIRRDI